MHIKNSLAAGCSDRQFGFRQFALALLTAVLTATPLSAVFAATAGNVLVIRGTVTAESPQAAERMLERGGEVFVEDTIRTGAGSYLVLKMIDDTKITLRPDSEIALNEYNASPGQESATVELFKGGLRTLSGAIGKAGPDAFKLQAQTTTIGIRGTNFVARMCQDAGSNAMCNNSCEVDERLLSHYARTASRPATVTPTQTNMQECQPMQGIHEGVYVGLYDGSVNVASNDESVDIAAIAAARATGGSPECLIDVPNFLTLDPYLSEDAEKSISEFNEDLDEDDMFGRVDGMLDNGYSPHIIYDNEMSRGSTLPAVVNAAVVSDPTRETEFRWLADIMLDGYPQTACGCLSFERGHDWNEISYDALEPKTIEEVARVWFEDEYRLARLIENSTHGVFPTAELAALAEEQKLWYRVLPVRNHPIPPGVFVSIYEDEEEIVVDGNLGAVQEALDRGDEYMPVVIQYYRKGTVPISRYPELMTESDVNDIFNDDNLEVSPVPNWKEGDYHAKMLVEEIEKLVSLPEQEDIDEELWAKIEDDLTTNGFLVPVIVTSGAGAWDIEVVNSEERVAVAKALGINEIPVVYFEPPPRPFNMSRCRRILRQDIPPEEFGYWKAGGSGGPSVQDVPPPPPPPPPPPLPIIPPPPPTSP